MPRSALLPVAALAFGLTLAVTGCTPLGEFKDGFGEGLGRDRTPLTLDDPLNGATRGRLARETREPQACRAWLTAQGVAFTPLADRDEGEFCRVRGAVALSDDLGDAVVRLSPRRPMMTCELAAAVAVWRKQSVEPAARELLGAGVSGIDHYGVYACRRVNNAAEGRASGHARAQAIDIAGFRLTNGRRVNVEKDWPKSGAEAAFLRRVRDDACRVFGETLSPYYNAVHANHLHLEMDGPRVCG